MSQQNINRFEFLFNSIELNLTNISQYLRGAGFQVKTEEQKLILNIFNGPTFYLNYSFGEFYLSELAVNARAREATRSISTYSSKIEVFFDDLDQVLNETKSLTELQTKLKEWQEGFLYRYWNQTYE